MLKIWVLYHLHHHQSYILCFSWIRATNHCPIDSEESVCLWLHSLSCHTDKKHKRVPPAWALGGRTCPANGTIKKGSHDLGEGIMLQRCGSRKSLLSVCSCVCTVCELVNPLSKKGLCRTTTGFMHQCQVVICMQMAWEKHCGWKLFAPLLCSSTHESEKVPTWWRARMHERAFARALHNLLGTCRAASPGHLVYLYLNLVCLKASVTWYCLSVLYYSWAPILLPPS